MFNKVLTADGIMSSFSKAITQLEDVADKSGKAIGNEEVKITNAKAAKEAAIVERDKALNFAKNLKGLMKNE